MTTYLLDTNVVRMLARDHPIVVANVIRRPVSAICISTITEGELRSGLARRPGDIKLGRTIFEFLRRTAIHPWDSNAAVSYARLNAELHRIGKTIDALDLLIAAHALSLGATLVSNDQAFIHIPDFALEDWTSPS